MAVFRVARCWLAVVLVVMGAVTGAPDGTVLHAAATSTELHLRLSAVDSLPVASKLALIAEANAIWNHAHIRLHWLGGGAASHGQTLRVLVMRHTVAATGEEPWAVAELLRFEGSQAIAVASIAGAERVIYQTQRRDLFERSALHEYRLGLVLGRAVAHEIGHYLLQTNDHTSAGLMRATIAAHEFADPRAVSFRLDDEARARLAMVAAQR